MRARGFIIVLHDPDLVPCLETCSLVARIVGESRRARTQLESRLEAERAFTVANACFEEGKRVSRRGFNPLYTTFQNRSACSPLPLRAIKAP